MSEQEQRKYGKASFGPQTNIVAGSRGTWSIAYEVGKAGVAIGGGIRIIPSWRHPREIRWEVGQVIAYTNREGSVAAVDTLNTYPLSYHLLRYPIIDVKIWNKPLKQGDTITVIIGNKGDYVSGYNLLAKAPEFACNGVEFEILLDLYGFSFYSSALEDVNLPLYWALKSGQIEESLYEALKIGYIKLPDPPRVNIIADRAAKLKVRVPATPKVNQPLSIHVRAEDKYGNVATSYQGTVELSSTLEPEMIDLPSEYSFKMQDKGVHLFVSQVKKACKTGFISAMDSENSFLAKSNPLSTTIAQLPYSIYFGEIHAHTKQSDGGLTLDEAYTYARDIAKLDFAAITDHSGGKDWKAAQKGARDYYQPGKFVTFLGYEYDVGALKYGHKNVYYLKDDEPVYNPDTPEKLWKLLKGKDAIAVPHHTNMAAEIPGTPWWRQQDWSSHNEELERLVEICQIRGSFETDSLSESVLFGGYGASVQDALAKGYRLGFTGGTDNHRGQLSSGKCPMAGLDYHGAKRSGLTAVYARSLTREAIWDAFYNRRTYATTGARILLKVSIQGHIMGEEFETNNLPVIKLQVMGTAKIKKIDLVKDNIDIYTHKGKSLVENFEYMDEEITPGTHYYYARITQVDKEMAWSSPIWVNYKTK